MVHSEMQSPGFHVKYHSTVDIITGCVVKHSINEKCGQILDMLHFFLTLQALNETDIDPYSSLYTGKSYTNCYSTAQVNFCNHKVMTKHIYN
jgi:hypothetical protein